MPCRPHCAQDIRWSPVESTVFSSCSADGTVAIWDVRKRAGSALSVKAHETDANVISWNGGVSYLLVSGADDGCFKIWDLRSIRAGNPVAAFTWHKAPITSIEWCAHSPAHACFWRVPRALLARAPTLTCVRLRVCPHIATGIQMRIRLLRLRARIISLLCGTWRLRTILRRSRCPRAGTTWQISRHSSTLCTKDKAT